jgi:hypothetical protein
MPGRVLAYLRSNVLAILALTVALGTGGAYAANTIRSSDIVDNEVNSADVKDNSINTFDVHSFLGVDVVDGSLTGADVADTSSLGPNDIFEEILSFNNTLIASDIATGAVGTDEVQNDSLTGADINEGSLSLPATTTTNFAAGSVTLNASDPLTVVAARFLPAGAYSVTATVHGTVGTFISGDHTVTLYCELRNGGSFIGAGTDRSVLIDAGTIDRTIPIVGGAQVPAGGGTVSLWCDSQANEPVEGQMMITRIDGFF